MGTSPANCTGSWSISKESLRRYVFYASQDHFTHFAAGGYLSQSLLSNPLDNAIDAAKQWHSDLVEAKYFKDLEENLNIIRLRFGEKSKPLFGNREFIVYEQCETMDDGTLVNSSN
ncbi:unnamed protein product [Fraxinus pennsylvanica]|uniref:Uncharacterized protein n=1 Tax=Fraxinus pennsylvanica TaxID=56036 RepID=A0AAD1ZGG1_9LAMI|nr:unnamed protein product [Fraxinus pennsylvanica]